MKKNILILISIFIFISSFSYAETEVYIIYSKNTNEIVTAGKVNRDRDQKLIDQGDNSTTLGEIQTKLNLNSDFDIIYQENQQLVDINKKKIKYFSKEDKDNYENLRKLKKEQDKKGDKNRENLRKLYNEIAKLKDELFFLKSYKDNLPKIINEIKTIFPRLETELTKRKRDIKFKNIEREKKLADEIEKNKSTLIQCEQEVKNNEINIILKENDINNKLAQRDLYVQEYKSIMISRDFYDSQLINENKKIL